MSKEILKMKTRQFATGSFLFAAFLASASASAQVRTFVASTGSDTNPCSRTAPCRTFQTAVNATAPGGEVVALNSAGFGSNVSINKAISIVAPNGVYAGVTVSSGDGIDINAGPSDTVILRGLTIIAQGTGGEGVRFTSGKTLHIESCVVNGFTTSQPASFLAGVLFDSTGNLEVKDSIMRGNDVGIGVTAARPGKAVAAIDHVRLEGNRLYGLEALDGSIVTVRDSLASDNGTGFAANSSAGAPVQLYIENCVASNNRGTGGTGILSFASDAVVSVKVSNSTVTNNSIGLQTVGPLAVLLSRGNNTVEGNTTATSGTISSFSPM
jgi:hypothetical protein